MKIIRMPMIAVLTACALALSAHAQETRKVFVEVTGLYALDAGADDWQILGPGSGTPTSQTGVGDGAVARLAVGSDIGGGWDVILSGQLGDFNKGDPSVGSVPPTGYLSATYQALDATFGYNTRIGDVDTRWGFGVRIADWDNEVTTDFPGEVVNHKWTGVGPRGEVQGTMPLSDDFKLRFGGGASYMSGDLKLTATPVWWCDDCVDYGADSWSFDGSVGVEWQIASSSTLTFGYRAEYWSDVNVAISDNSGLGLNAGTSGHLIQGPFVSWKFTAGK